MNQQISMFSMNDNGYLFDPQTGLSYMTNSTGLVILKALRDACDMKETIAALVEAFQVSPSEAERDVIDFMELLRSKGVIA